MRADNAISRVASALEECGAPLRERGNPCPQTMCWLLGRLGPLESRRFRRRRRRARNTPAQTSQLLLIRELPTTAVPPSDANQRAEKNAGNDRDQQNDDEGCVEVPDQVLDLHGLRVLNDADENHSGEDQAEQETPIQPRTVELAPSAVVTGSSVHHGFSRP